MSGPRELYVPSQAEDYFRELEQYLVDLGHLLARLGQAMVFLSQEYRSAFRKSRLVLYPKERPGEAEPCALYWSTLSRAPEKVQEHPPPSGEKKANYWVHHVAGGLTHDLIFTHARDVARAGVVWEYDRRAAALNEACHEVRKAIMRIEHALLARGLRRSWEGGDVDLPAPSVSPALRAESRRALGSGWFMLLRMAGVEGEMIALAERYQADPVHPGLRLAFQRDPEHRFGRLGWLHYKGRLPRLLGRERARGILTDRVMRAMRIGEAVRRLLARHERERRRMASLHGWYTRVLGDARRHARVALAKADLALLAAVLQQMGAG